MSVEYDLYQTPTPENSGKKPQLHARVANANTINMKHLAKKIEKSTTISRADMMAVIVELGNAFITELSNGNRLHIEGIGYFQMTLSCPAGVEKPSDIRSESISFKSISFTPEKMLKRQLQGIKFVRSTRSNHSMHTSDAEIQSILAAYFENHSYITRAEFERIFYMTRSTAFRRIKALVKAGFLQRDPTADLYLPVQ